MNQIYPDNSIKCGSVKKYSDTFQTCLKLVICKKKWMFCKKKSINFITWNSHRVLQGISVEVLVVFISFNSFSHYFTVTLSDRFLPDISKDSLTRCSTLSRNRFKFQRIYTKDCVICRIAEREGSSNKVSKNNEWLIIFSFEHVCRKLGFNFWFGS